MNNEFVITAFFFEIMIHIAGRWHKNDKNNEYEDRTDLNSSFILTCESCTFYRVPRSNVCMCDTDTVDTFVQAPVLYTCSSQSAYKYKVIDSVRYCF